MLEENLYFLERSGKRPGHQRPAGAGGGAGLCAPGGRGRRAQKKKAESPFLRFVSGDGFVIQAGRNSAQNERLLKQARGEDVWLHARDIPGSHVLISAAGKPVTEGTLQEAAQIAAFYSQARGKATQVDYTLRKFVRKTPGAGPGQVHYTGEKSLIAEANEAQIEGLKA